MVQKVGFFGILVCASITNPMFDLADITWFPFGPFFGATQIGKAIAKMHIQKLFVIITFSRHIVEQMVSLIGTNWLLWVFEKVIVVMVCFFVCSIVNSTAQSYAKREAAEVQ